MPKITLTDLTNLQNETTVVSKINLNNSLVETAIENTLSRDGSSPNMMGANLDMNSNRILNLPAPSVNTEPVRRYDLDVAIKGIVDFQNTLTEKVSEASDYATQAEISAASAYSSYVLASSYADSLSAVSTTSNAIENGSKMFSIQTGKQFKNGQYVFISYTQDVTKYLYGYITDYTGSSLTVQVVATQGSGTYADWTIGLSAIRGPQGEAGPKGDTGDQGPQGLQGPAGNTGPAAWAAPVAWQTGQSYTAAAPASVVTQSGETYVCIVSHSSGTFSVDLAAAKWLKIAAKGADGSGTGDMLKADNLSGLANVATARTNLGATTVGDALFTATDAAAARSTIGINSISAILPGYIYGLTLSTAGSSTTFSVATGVATDASATDTISLGSAISKTTSSWSVGTGNGALDTGTIANNTWYHVFAIKRTDSGVVDVLVSTSVSSPTMPTNYTLKRRIGSMRTNGSGQWTAFVQSENEFYWTVPSFDVDVTPGTTAVQTATLRTPLGVSVYAMLGVGATSGSSNGGRALIYSPLIGNSLTTATGPNQFNAGVSGGVIGANVQNWQMLNVRTNTLSQVYYSVSATDATLRLLTYGWIDSRN